MAGERSKLIGASNLKYYIPIYRIREKCGNSKGNVRIQTSLHHLLDNNNRNSKKQIYNVVSECS